MTRSDVTALSAGAIDVAARRVGASHAGDAVGEARVALVCAKFNGGITERLLEGALAGLEASAVKADTVTVAWVPGAFELPLVAMRLAESGAVDAVVALGAVIRGETAHFDFVAGECASGLQRAALDTGVPVVFGVLTTDTVDQALDRCSGGQANKGYEAALTALEMVDLLRQVSGVDDRTGALSTAAE
jgi:6,7-dimethyl-8-ribityllumazine synthase